MRKIAKIAFIFSLTLLLTIPLLGIGMAQVPPTPPHAFYGYVLINGSLAPDGVVVSAKIEGVTYATATVQNGSYMLEVPADNATTPEKDGGVDGDLIEFYVGEAYADSFTFMSMSIDELNLTVTDNTPPTITNLTPEDGANVTTATPQISAVVKDPGGVGVDPASISLKLDGTPVSHTYNNITGLVSYTPTQDLSYGTHTVELTAKDYGENEKTETWSFFVTVGAPPPPPPTEIATVELTANTTEITAGESINFTVGVYDENGHGIENVTTKLYINETLKATATTNEDGIASFLTSFPDAGTFIAYATADNVTSNEVTITVTEVVPFDFTLSVTPKSREIEQEEAANFVISVELVSGEPVAVSLKVGGLPKDVDYQLSPKSGTPPFTSTLTITTTDKTPTGRYTILISGEGGGVTKTATVELEIEEKPKKRCIIATATYGSELAPEVQFLREFRDDLVLKTFAGACFMRVFNAWYYSFSPTVAEIIAANDWLRVVMRLALYPLIGILHVSAVVCRALSFNSELGVVVAGLIASTLIGSIYFTPIALMIIKLLHRKNIKFKYAKALIGFWLVTLTLIAIGESVSSTILMMFATSAIILETLTISAIITAGITKSILKGKPNP